MAALAPAQAFAGAWVAAEGGQEIWTSVAGERGGLNFFESSAYWEAPFSETTSVVAAPWMETNYDSEDGWRAEAVVGVKQAVFRSEDMVSALQAGALWQSHPDGECGEGGVELRWLGGRNLGERAFLNIEAAARALDGGCESQRSEVTVGFRPAPNWLAMAQLFQDAPTEGDDTLKAQLTIVRFSESGRGFQIGLRARIGADDAEPALVVGLWGRPRD